VEPEWLLGSVQPNVPQSMCCPSHPSFERRRRRHGKA
jgi:hypothetical protein